MGKRVHVVINMGLQGIKINIRGTCMHVSTKYLPTCGLKGSDEQGVISKKRWEIGYM